MPSSEELNPVPPSATVVVLESNRLCSELIRRAVDKNFPDAIIQLAGRIADADPFIAQHTVDLLIAGTEISDGDIFDRLKQWGSRPNQIKRTLLITDRRDRRSLSILNSLRLDGVFDPRIEGAAALDKALETIACGGTYWTSELIRDMHNQFMNRESVLRRLSPTQLVVLALVGTNATDAAIARQLGLSENTVESTRRDIRSILNARRQSDLAFVAVREGLVRLLPERLEIPGYACLLAERGAGDLKSLTVE